MTPDPAAATADPETAAPRLAEALEASPRLAADRTALSILAHLFAGSDPLSAWLSRRPEDVDWLVADGRLTGEKPRDAGAMRAHLDELAAEGRSPDDAVRIFRNRELARLCARELSGAAETETVLAEWSTVADVAIDAACRTAAAEMAEKHGTPYYAPLEGGEERVASFAVLGMGKLGGGELNISSDVDLIYVHSSDNGESRGGSAGGLPCTNISSGWREGSPSSSTT